MQIQWTTIGVLVIVFFAINGFFRGWWKEAFASLTIAAFIFLMQQPELATWIVELINTGLTFMADLLNRLLGVYIDFGVTPQLDPNSPSTWVVLLFLTLGVGAMLSRLFLPGSTGHLDSTYYAPSFVGRLLGLVVGTVNGFLILNLVTEFVAGTVMPANVETATAAASAASDITIVGSTYGRTVDNVSIQAVGLPDFTIFDSFVPWVLAGAGALLFVVALQTRISWQSNKDGTKVGVRAPYGYSKIDVKKPKPEPTQNVKVIP